MTTTELENPSAAAPSLMDEVDRWVAKAIAADTAARSAVRELEELEAGAAEQLLEDDSPEAAARITARKNELRGVVEMQGQVAVLAEHRCAQARAEVVRAEAVAMDDEVSAARSALDKHNASVEKARAALEKLAGMPVRLLSLDQQIQEHRDASGGPASFRTPVDDQLQSALDEVEQRRAVLHAAADNAGTVREKFPTLSWSALPASLREGGVLPVPGFYAPVVRDFHEELDELLAEVEEHRRAIAGLEAYLAKHRDYPHGQDDASRRHAYKMRDALAKAHTLRHEALRAGVELPPVTVTADLP